MTPDELATDLLPHDIVGPVWYWPYPWPVMLAAVAVLLALLAVAGWLLVRWSRRRSRRQLTPRAKALSDLDRAQARLESTPPYEFSIEVCDILRSFLAAEHRLPAPRLTSYEFLKAARDSGIFDPSRMDRLERFLGKADSIKFARVEAGGSDNEELIALAGDLVREEVTGAADA